MYVAKVLFVNRHGRHGRLEEEHMTFPPLSPLSFALVSLRRSGWRLVSGKEV